MDNSQCWLIWSEEHGAWWAPAKSGYTRSLQAAGRYSEEDARLICRSANFYCKPGSWKECCLPEPHPLLPEMVSEHPQRDQDP